MFAALLDTLVATSCQLPVPFAAAWLLDRALPRHAWPELRAAAWTLVACKLVLPPTLGTAWLAPLATLTTPPPVAVQTLHTHAWVAWPWLLGSLVCVLTFALRHRLALAAAQRTSTPLPAALAAELASAARRCGVRSLPRVLHVADGLGSRVLLGTRTLLVLDAHQLAGMTPAARTHLLLHELMHVRRADPWRALALGTLCAAFWFHPLVWLLARRMHQLRELCCDQAVVQRLGGDPHAYRSTLLAAARTLVATPAHGFAPWGSLVLQRLHALEQPRHIGASLRRTTIAAATALFAVACVPLAPPALGFDLEAALHSPGCLNRQFAAFAALAQAEAASPSSATEASR